MSAKKFKFVSPGIFLSEIDNSQIPKEPGGIGPVVIGRTRRGPAMKPVQVSSFQEFIEIFGEPVPGNEGEDPWRDGNGLLSTAYAPYAAQAYLKARINSPVTVIRLLGVEGDDASDAGQAGWEATRPYGIFVAPAPSGSTSGLGRDVQAHLCGIVYSMDAKLKVGIDGTKHGHSVALTENWAHTSSFPSAVANPAAVDVASHAFTLALTDGTTTTRKKVSFRQGNNFIRDRLNTSPVATNTDISTVISGTLADKYWLGETFEEEYEVVAKRASDMGHGLVAFAQLLDENLADFKSTDHQLEAARSGWIIPQYEGAPADYNPTKLEKLFRFHAIQEGEQGLDIHTRIENVKIADEGNPSPYGRFDVVVYQRQGDKVFKVDSFENLNLNPNSDNFVARRIGTQFFEWDKAQKRNKVYGDYPNNSSYIRVEMGGEVGQNGPANPKSVPFGFLGPIKPADAIGVIASTSSGSVGNDNWVTGAVEINNMESLKYIWPTAPHVTTGSLGIDLAAKYVFGGTPYNKETGTENISYFSVNKGKKDYLRKFSTYGSSAVLSAQKSGVATQTAVHSYVFSLDEVFITGASNPTEDLTSYVPTQVEFISGSHRGSTAATATIRVDDGDAAHGLTAGQKITLTSTDGTMVDYFISDTADGGRGHLGAIDPATPSSLRLKDTGTIDAVLTPGAKAIAVGYNVGGGNTQQQVLQLLKAAIEHANGHNGKINVSAVPTQAHGNQDITLTQAVSGSGGNTTSTENLATISVHSDFSGGNGPKSASIRAYTALESGSAAAILDLVNCFSVPMVGGCDGVDITEADPFNMAGHGTRTTAGPDSTTRNSYAHASVDRAIELIKDPEALEMNLAVIPGITNPSLTTKLVQVCEAGADALAIIDLPDVYVPPSQKKCETFKNRLPAAGSPENSAKNLMKRQINSSYGATYYPWVKVRDTVNGRDQWVPPSVIALGVMGFTEQRDAVWFAPAGFNRGGLNEGNAGLPVLQVSEQLLSSQRDKLYEANINPIASFVSEGLVVFGQKTLQMTPSALDRINVRRLLIFIKKQISVFASQLLFDQNVPATWNRFTGLVVPFLEGVKTSLGLTDFKVVLDNTTTTPDLIDRNVMYAKIFLKPARAIEFIAVDFVITRTGASFDD